MKIKHILALAVLAISAASCITDDSTQGNNATSKLALATPLEKTYTVNRWDKFELDPEITQTNTQKEIAYEWEIDYKKVADTKKLSYLCKDFGEHPVRLKITNGDDIKLYEFTLNVQYSYVQGLYILADYQGKSIVSYLPDGVEKKNFELDALSKNNETEKFPADPKAIAFANVTGTPVIFVAMGNPSKVYEMNANLMTVFKGVDAGGEVSWLAMNPQSYPKQLLMTVGHQLMGKEPRQDRIFDLTYSLMRDLKEKNSEFADNMTLWYRSDKSYIHAIAFFDNAHGHLVAKEIETGLYIPKEILPGTFTGQRLIGMGGSDGQRDLAMITKTADGKFMFYNIFPGYYRRNKDKKVIDAVIKFSGEMPATSGIADGSIIRTAPEHNMVIYTNGNKVYDFSVLSNGNYPVKEEFTVGDANEKIADMYVSADNSKLYVATNDNTKEKQGSIYCYDINNKFKKLWEKKNITGKIKNMTYREQ
uniref:Bacteroidetes PKD-like domain-containing protein n=2 Tax=unclassified Prevotella TaxID=2638335 RepID=A0AB33J121_9BACT